MRKREFIAESLALFGRAGRESTEHGYTADKQSANAT
jgi:hypothetical protein